MTAVRTFASFFASSAIAFCLLSAQAGAQINAQTGSADPGRASEEMRRQLPVLPSSPPIGIKPSGLLDAPEGAENMAFGFGGLLVEGNRVYAASELAALYQDRIGQQITLADLYRLVNDITLKYRHDGYVLAQAFIPPQEIEPGHPVRVRVVEGHIDQIHIQADESEGRIALDTIRWSTPILESTL